MTLPSPPMPSSPETLRLCLKSADVATRRRSLRELNEPDNAAPFLELLRECLTLDPVWSVREAAAESLGRLARHCRNAGSETIDRQRAVLVSSCLLDSSDFVREMCRQQLVELDVGWAQTFAILDDMWKHERIHIRRRVLQAYSDFADRRTALPYLTEAVSDGHWKLRCTALVELRKHPANFLTLISGVTRRCFDFHSSVARRAQETVHHFQTQLPPTIASALEETTVKSGPDATLTCLSQHAPAAVLESFDVACRQRLGWHRNHRGVEICADHQSHEDSVRACIDAAKQARQPERNSHREYVWLVGRLCELLAADEGSARS